MNKSVSIKRNGIVTNGPVVGEEAEVMEWLNSCLAKKKFGKPERWVSPEEESIGGWISKEEREIEPAHTIEVPAQYDEEGEEISPARTEHVPAVKKWFYKLPADYVIIIEDYKQDYRDARRTEYAKHIDPVFQEAILENMLGQPDKMDQLLKVYDAIKKKHPKP